MINLLPPKKKEELLQEQNYKVFLILGFLIIVFLVALFLSLLAVRIYISGQIAHSNTNLPDQLLSSQQIITEINTNMEKIDYFYSNQPDFTALVEEIFAVIPQRVTISSLTVNFSPTTEGFPVSLQGFSPTRDILFQLKKNLESENIFSEINFPASNWIKPSDINFEVNFQADL